MIFVMIAVNAQELFGVPTKFLNEYIEAKKIDNVLIVVEDNTTSKHVITSVL